MKGTLYTDHDNIKSDFSKVPEQSLSKIWRLPVSNFAFGKVFSFLCVKVPRKDVERFIWFACLRLHDSFLPERSELHMKITVVFKIISNIGRRNSFLNMNEQVTQ